MLSSLFVAASILVFGQPASRLAVISRAPEFTLVSQRGKPVQSSALREKVSLVSFIFTTCSGTCPATTHRMCQVQDALKAEGLTKDGQVRLISITLDPKRDTSEVLRNYMRLYDVDADLWTFLTGEPELVAKTVEAWGMWARPAANGQLDHPSRVFLVDRQGRIREIYDLSFLKAAWVVDDIKALLTERQ